MCECLEYEDGGMYLCECCTDMRRVEQEQLGRLQDRVKLLEKEIVHYVSNPGCNGPAKKKAIKRLMSAVMSEEG